MLKFSFYIGQSYRSSAVGSSPLSVSTTNSFVSQQVIWILVFVLLAFYSCDVNAYHFIIIMYIWNVFEDKI